MIEITRSYSRKIQVRQYEPVEFFCSAKQEVAEDDALETSAKLDLLVQSEVEKSIAQMNNAKAMCLSCGGIVRYGGTQKSGELCENCATSEKFKAIDAKK